MTIVDGATWILCTLLYLVIIMCEPASMFSMELNSLMRIWWNKGPCYYCVVYGE